MNSYLRMASLAAAILLPAQNARAVVVNPGETWSVAPYWGTIVDAYVLNTIPTFHASWEGSTYKDFCSFCPPSWNTTEIFPAGGSLHAGLNHVFVGDMAGTGDFHLMFMTITNISATADISISGSWSRIQPQAVPLPAALPLFATGLGVMGLLGWRRKRRVAR